MFSSSTAPCSKPNTPHSPEESSWTMYFQGFNENEHTSFSSSPFEKTHHHSSLASHASSLAPQELSSYHDSRKKPRRKLIGVAVDDELEDTASSPVNSPKVREFLVRLYTQDDMFWTTYSLHALLAVLGH